MIKKRYAFCGVVLSIILLSMVLVNSDSVLVDGGNRDLGGGVERVPASFPISSDTVAPELSIYKVTYQLKNGHIVPTESKQTFSSEQEKLQQIEGQGTVEQSLGDFTNQISLSCDEGNIVPDIFINETEDGGFTYGSNNAWDDGSLKNCTYLISSDDVLTFDDNYSVINQYTGASEDALYVNNFKDVCSKEYANCVFTQLDDGDVQVDFVSDSNIDPDFSTNTPAPANSKVYYPNGVTALPAAAGYWGTFYYANQGTGMPTNFPWNTGGQWQIVPNCYVNTTTAGKFILSTGGTSCTIPGKSDGDVVDMVVVIWPATVAFGTITSVSAWFSNAAYSPLLNNTNTSFGMFLHSSFTLSSAPGTNFWQTNLLNIGNRAGTNNFFANWYQIGYNYTGMSPVSSVTNSVFSANETFFREGSTLAVLAPWLSNTTFNFNAAEDVYIDGALNASGVTSYTVTNISASHFLNFVAGTFNPNITSCTTLGTAGTYILLNNISGSCLTITADNVAVNGNGFSITSGNVSANGGSNHAGYSNVTLFNFYLINGSISSNANGYDFGNNGMSGGSITITNVTSITGSITSTGSPDNFGGTNAGGSGAITITTSNLAGTITTLASVSSYGYAINSGSVTLINSTSGNIISYGPQSAAQFGGAGGSATLTNSIAGTITCYGGGQSGGFAGGGNSGSVTLTNSQVSTITAYGGNGGSNAPAGNGAAAIITNSTTGNIDAHGGAGAYANGNGGTVNIINSSFSPALTVNILGGSGMGAIGTFKMNNSNFLNSFGSILYNYMNSSSVNFTLILSISSNSILVNSASYADYNKSATLSFYNSGTFTTPIALKDGVQCPSSICTALVQTGNNYTFNVTGFTTYSIGEGTPITITLGGSNGNPYPNNQPILLSNATYNYGNWYLNQYNTITISVLDFNNTPFDADGIFAELTNYAYDNLTITYTPLIRKSVGVYQKTFYMNGTQPANVTLNTTIINGAKTINKNIVIPIYPENFLTKQNNFVEAIKNKLQDFMTFLKNNYNLAVLFIISIAIIISVAFVLTYFSAKRK